MDCDSTLKEGLSVPEVDYFAKGNDLAATLDRHFITLYTALITGLLFLLFTQSSKFGYWPGAFFLGSLILFLFGIAHSLCHVVLHAKLLLLMEALVGGTDFVPNMLDGRRPTPDEINRTLTLLQRAFSGQLMYLLFGMASAMVGTFIHLWDYAWRCGMLIAIPCALLFAVVIAYYTWRKKREL
jgi:hypothetical protein